MQPKEKRARLQSAGPARARMFLKSELGWLPGFPRTVGDGMVTWVTVPRDGGQGVQVLQLDREHLQRATSACTKLLHGFPRALPRLVGNVERWQTATSTIFEFLTAAIHKGQALPASLVDRNGAFNADSRKLAKKLTRDQPELGSLISALSWTTLLTPQDFRDGLQWIAANTDALRFMCKHADAENRDIGPLQLLELTRRMGANRTEQLVAALGSSYCHRFPTATVNFSSDVGRIMDELGKDGSDVAAIDAIRPLLSNAPKGQDLPGRCLREFLDWLLIQDRATVRRALEALELLLPPSVFTDWQDWWRKRDGCLQEINRLAIPAQLDRAIARRLLQRLVDSQPPRFHLRSTLVAIQYASLPGHRMFYSELLAVVSALPWVEFRTHVRAAFWAHWTQLERDHPGRTMSLLKQLRRYQRAQLSPECLYAPWRRGFENWNKEGCAFSWMGPSEDLLEMRGGAAARERALEVLSYCVDADGDATNDRNVEWALVLAQRSASTGQACDRYSAIRSQGLGDSFPRKEWVRVVDRLAQDAADFVAIYHSLADSDRVSAEDVEQLIALDDHLRRRGWNGLLRTVIRQRQFQLVAPLLPLLRISQLLSKTVEPPEASKAPEVPAWASEYSGPVQRALAVLNAVNPDAEAASREARKFLCFEPDRIDSEIQAIEKLLSARPDNSSLRTRLEKLRIRRSHPVVATTAQLRKAVERIERLVHATVLRVWRAALDAALRESLPGFLKTDRDVSVLLEDRHLTVLAAAMELTGTNKALALKLYRRRCGPPPWNMQDHPANVAFVQRMADRGLNMVPWLARKSARMWTGSNGAQVHVGLEEDPLEIFQMGTHFCTCLSPGETNFFSVFANAADVNKRVLFARDRDGHVVGRCLIAISESGGLLTFHPYSHDPALGFEAVVKETADRLATEMGTLVVCSGTVSTLVADEWYDDGPVDLCGRFPCLEEGSAFRNTLVNAPLTDVRQLIATAFAPHALSALTLSMLLELPEFANRPELVRPLRHDLENAEGLNTEHWVTAVRSATAAGDRALAVKLMTRHLVPSFLREHRRRGWIPSEWLEVIAAADPSTAIRLLRSTRPKGVRRDDEDEEDRKRILATALRALGRRKQASALLS